jgi:hypothetical protein
MNPTQARPYCSKGVFGYLYLLLAGLATAPGIALLAYNLAAGKDLSPFDYDVFRCTEDQLLLLLAGIPFALAAFVLLAVLVYKIWAALPPEYARTTPGKAVGFLFIPLFNYYWYFVALFGWTEDFRRYARERSFAGPRPSPFVASAIGVLNLVTTPLGIATGLAEIPLAGSVIGLPLTVLLVVFAFQACAAVNALPPEAVQSARAARGTPAADGSQPTGKGTASLVLGILSLILPYLGFILGIVGIVLAIGQRKRYKTGVSMAGLILSICGTAFYGLCFLVVIVVLITVA